MHGTSLLITVDPAQLPNGSGGQVCQLVRALLTTEPFRIGGSITDKDLKNGRLVDFGEEALRNRFVSLIHTLLNEAVMVGISLDERD